MAQASSTDLMPESQPPTLHPPPYPRPFTGAQLQQQGAGQRVGRDPNILSALVLRAAPSSPLTQEALCWAQEIGGVGGGGVCTCRKGYLTDMHTQVPEERSPRTQ